MGSNMKRTSSMALFTNLTDRRVTRQQIKFIQAIFPFLLLPAELRDLIYFFCISFMGINRAFDDYYKEIKAQAELGNYKPHAPVVERGVPSIFLVNRQIFTEAIAALRQHTITFNHGIFNTKLINIIKHNPLRHLGSIEINDNGHPLLAKKTLNCTWHGYTRLLHTLADILSDGHRLKNFTLRLNDPSLVEHVTKCAAGAWSCGFRDQMREAVESLKAIRGVKNVTIIGVEHSVAQDVKYRMQSTTITKFNDIPLTIRNKIYDYALDWSDSSKIFQTSLAKWNPRTPFSYPERSCPTVLLINKQYTREALAVLHSKSLNITFPKVKAIRSTFNLPRLPEFITVHTIHQVTELNITIKHWKWAYAFILPFTNIMHNCKKLQKVTITIEDGEKHAVLEMPPPAGSTLLPRHASFIPYTVLQGMTTWGATGDLHHRYMRPLIYALIGNDPMRRQQYPQLPDQSTLLGKLVYGGYY